MARKAIHKSTIGHAKRLYLLNEFTLEFIGEVVGVTASTVAAWRDENEWDKERKLDTDLQEKYLKILNVHADQILEAIEEARENDTPIVIPKASDVSGYQNYVKRKELVFEEVVRLLSGFLEYVATTNLALANDLKPIATAYIMKQEKLLRKWLAN